MAWSMSVMGLLSDVHGNAVAFDGFEKAQEDASILAAIQFRLIGSRHAPL